ncbi:uncharacterized protein TNCV_1756471 [Trichonephila clavipes]|nr:uncharacterized protein TNCV_1756471 [Trichonephila clavipes]
MEVNALKAARKGLRIAFSLSLKKRLKTEFTKENIDMNQLSILKTQFIDKFQRLDTCQNQISEQLFGTLFLEERKLDLSALYDELEGNYGRWRALTNTRKYGDFLTPLVESCLPEEILMAWERKRNTETDAKGSRTLEHLMTFLRLEVQGEEMVQLAKSGFGTPIRKKKKRFPN